jgi:universal stress protein A
VAVRFGDPVKEILLEAEEYAADLIVVATSARCAIMRTLVGSVAEAVLRRADVPVLLHRAAA